MSKDVERSVELTGQAAKICLPSKRNYSRELFQSAPYEAQDVLAGTANADLINMEPGRNYQLRNKWQRRLLYRGLAPGLAFVNPGLKTIKLSDDYDCLIAFCQNHWDLLAINALNRWKDCCKVSVCWLSEIYAADVIKYPDLLRSLKRFDHVITSSQGTVGPLSEFLGRKCHFVATGIDSLRFTPYPECPDRAITIYGIGRRWEGIHNALLSGAAAKNFFYVYDSYRAISEMQVIDHKQHRDLFASIAKRSKYFMVAPGKMDKFSETHNQVEIGYRYFEGAAAGAVMLGQAADCAAFRDLFPWPDAVIEIKPDGSDVLEIIADLEANPRRVESVSRMNALQSLLRHDWIYRWIEVFQIAGLAPSPGMLSRVCKLQTLAHSVQQPLEFPVQAPVQAKSGRHA